MEVAEDALKGRKTSKVDTTFYRRNDADISLIRYHLFHLTFQFLQLNLLGLFSTHQSISGLIFISLAARISVYFCLIAFPFSRIRYVRNAHLNMVM